MGTLTHDTGNKVPGLEETLLDEQAVTDDEAARALPTGHARFARGRELGRGGMGRVVEATDLQFNRIVAVKEVHAATPGTKRRFATEAVVTGHLEHPGIPSVYERGFDDGGRPFYAMRRVQGRTFAALLAEADTRERRLAMLPVVTRVAQTIGFAHERGVVHRDIKPDNILVGDHGEVVVLDWGLARVRGVPHESAGRSDLPVGPNQTVHGAVIGTPAYMAPEQAEGALDRIDERSDVFALGALLYHVLAGSAPYRGGTVDDILGAARAAKLPPMPPGAPPELVAICKRAMSREPADRHRNAHELARDLEGFAARAVLGRPSRAIQIAVDVLTAVMVVVALIGVFQLMRRVSSVEQQGPGGYAVLGVGAIGAVLSVIEWQTRGRYKLAPLALAFAGTTFLGGIADIATGGSKILESLASVDDGQFYRKALTTGLYEVLGSMATATILTMFQLFLWAAARRRAS